MRQGEGAGRLDATLPSDERGSEVQRMLALTTFLGAAPQGEATEFPLLREDHVEAEALLRGLERPLLGLHVGARDRARRWEPDRFAEVGLALHARRGGALVLLGDGETQAASDWISRRAGRAGVPYLDLTGRTALPTLGAVIARLGLLITNDSGPAHIAYALDTPSVTIFGGANPRAYGPPAHGVHTLALHDVACRPTDRRTCASCPYQYACLAGVTVAQVLALAERTLEAAPEGQLIG